MSAEVPTADEIGSAILLMFNTLLIIDGEPGLVWQENVTEAIERFDRPELRSRLVELLYERAPITPIMKGHEE